MKESPDINIIPVAMSISQPKDFYFPDMENIPLYFSSHSPWESFPVAMVISSRGFNKHTVGSVKRRFEQLIKANSDKDACWLLNSTPLFLFISAIKAEGWFRPAGSVEMPIRRWQCT